MKELGLPVTTFTENKNKGYYAQFINVAAYYLTQMNVLNCTDFCRFVDNSNVHQTSRKVSFLIARVRKLNSPRVGEGS